MAYTQSQLQSLRDALASGVLIVEFNGRRVQYRSVDELRKAISDVENSLNNRVGRRRYVLNSRKGF